MDRFLEAKHKITEVHGQRFTWQDRRVPNDGYITTPDAPSECYLVIFQVGPAESL